MVEHYVTLVHRPDHRVRRVRHGDVIGVPAIVTVDWLGLDVKDWRAMPRRTTRRSRRAPSSELPAGGRGRLPVPATRDPEVIAARGGRTRQDDIISYLVQQEVDDRPVTDDEVF